MRLDIQQNTNDWLELRKGKIGASDAPIIMEVSPWKTPFQLWQEKLNLVDQPDETFAQAEGKRKEPIARNALERLTGLCFNPQVYVHDQMPWMMASLDAVDLSQSIAAEIKCVGVEDHELAHSGKVPDKYYPQLQHQMHVIGMPFMLYFSFHDGDGKIVEVSKNQDYVIDMIKKEEEFYAKLSNNIAPDLIEKDYRHHESMTRVLHALTLFDLMKKEKELKRQIEETKKILLDDAPDGNSIGGGLKITKYYKKGSINYSAIPELKDLDLESFRGESSLCYRFSQA